MKRKLTLAWNLVLILFVVLGEYGFAPQVISLFQFLDELAEGSFRTRAMMLGFEGIGLLILIAAGALSLSSIFWRKVSWPWRAVYGVIVIAAGLGSFIAIEINRKDMGFVSFGDYLTFVFNAVMIVLPILLFGVGYPNLFFRVYRRVMRK
ncbi:MAG: hypothetical protein ACSHX9_06400 [Luteolibacter sp.]